MFCGPDGEEYQSSWSFKPKVEIKGEGTTPICHTTIEPPSAERMLKKLRQKLKGKGLKEI